VTTAATHHATRAARRRALGRERAARWRERHAAEIEAMRAAAATAEADAAALREASGVDAAMAFALVERHAALRAGAQHRDVGLPLVDVLAAARAKLRANGMEPDAARDAVNRRLAHHAASVTPDSCALPNRE